MHISGSNPSFSTTHSLDLPRFSVNRRVEAPIGFRTCIARGVSSQVACPRRASGAAYVAERDTLGRWAKALMSRAHPNVAVVAFANKLARIASAVRRHGEAFAVKGSLMVA